MGLMLASLAVSHYLPLIERGGAAEAMLPIRVDLIGKYHAMLLRMWDQTLVFGDTVATPEFQAFAEAINTGRRDLAWKWIAGQHSKLSA